MGVQVVICGIGSAVGTPCVVIIPAICAVWMGPKKVIEVPTGMTRVGLGVRGLALR